MINVIYDSKTDMFTFMAAPNEEESLLGPIMNLDELLEVVSGEFALFASCMAGDTEEAYLSVVKTLENAGKDEKIKEGLDLMIKENKETIFMNDEPKEECVRHLAYSFKESLNEIDNGFMEIFGEDFKDKLIEHFKEEMIEMYGVNIDNIFEKSSIDDYEEDLF